MKILDSDFHRNDDFTGFRRNSKVSMYVGAFFTLGEFAGGILHIVPFDCMKFFPIVKEVNIRFRRPPLTDVVMEVHICEEEAEALLTEAQEKGKTDFPKNLALIDASGETMAELKKASGRSG